MHVLRLLVLTGLALAAPALVAAQVDLTLLNLPDGFEVSLFAEDVPLARSLTVSDAGVVYVGTMSMRSRDGSSVYALVDADKDGRAERKVVVDEGLFMPNGVAWHRGDLYVAEVNRVLRYDDIDEHLDAPPEPVVVSEEFPSDRHHGWKFIRFGPDGKLYVPVGAPCNICEKEDPYAAILRMNADGSDLEVFARGVRNTVGFDWHPESGELWFTDNGRDMMGNDLPPDELNRVPRAGLHFGYPYCHAGDIVDPQLGEGRSCDEFEPPAVALGPHVAAIGLRFYTGEMFPAEYRNRILFAEHGSWNRDDKIGYRVMMVDVDAAGNATGYRPFVDGWLQDGQDWGRPADVEVLADGSLLISDDKSGVVYRVIYSGGTAASAGGH